MTYPVPVYIDSIPDYNYDAEYHPVECKRGDPEGETVIYLAERDFDVCDELQSREDTYVLLVNNDGIFYTPNKQILKNQPMLQD